MVSPPPGVKVARTKQSTSSSSWMYSSASHGFRALLLFVAIVTLTVLLNTTTTASSNNSGTAMTRPSSIVYSDHDFVTTPMCNDQGICGEEATVPTPRTVYSAKSLEQYDKWWRAHEALKASASAAFSSASDNESGKTKKPRLIFLGDSITESWLGTNMGEPEDRAEQVPQVLQAEFADYETLVLAIGGDQVQHLEWRLFAGGELVPEIVGRPQQDDDNKNKRHHHRYDNDNELTTHYIILIGTNNLGSGMLPESTVDGIVHLVQTLLDKTIGQQQQAKIMVLQLLPRGDAFRLPNICPPRCQNNDGKTPFTSFMPAVHKVNQGLVKRLPSIKQHRERGPRQGAVVVSLVDCSDDFVSKNSTEGEEVNVKLMPDKLHPNAAGHLKLARCIKKHLT